MSVAVIGMGVDPAVVAEIARLNGWAVAAAPQAGQVSLAACKRLDGAGIAGCLGAGCNGIIETDARPPWPMGRHFRRHLAAGGLALALRTDTAYGCDAARLFGAALCQHFPIGERDGDVLLAIHELVGNALIHGNLGVAAFTGDCARFDDYCQRLDAALADLQLIQRCLEVSAAVINGGVEIAIRDEGAGYEGSARPGQAPDPVRRHGLSIAGGLGALAVEEGGRCAVLTILRAGKATP